MGLRFRSWKYSFRKGFVVFEDPGILQQFLKRTMQKSDSRGLSSLSHVKDYYECPCQKVYKSYPALYTHIKNKHEGKAPGTIRKPDLPIKKKGRPVVNKTHTSLGSRNQLQSQNIELGSSFDGFLSSNANRLTPSQECIQKTTDILERMPNQQIDRSHLHELATMTEMMVYMSTGRSPSEKTHVGSVVKEFLNELSQEVAWPKFKHFATMLLMFLQFISDQLGHSQVIEQSVDILCMYINEFIESGVDRMLPRYGMSELGVFEHKRMMDLLSWFFKWLMAKDYTSYRITLNQNFKREETQITIDIYEV